MVQLAEYTKKELEEIKAEKEIKTFDGVIRELLHSYEDKKEEKTPEDELLYRHALKQTLKKARKEFKERNLEKEVEHLNSLYTLLQPAIEEAYPEEILKDIKKSLEQANKQLEEGEKENYRSLEENLSMARAGIHVIAERKSKGKEIVKLNKKEEKNA